MSVFNVTDTTFDHTCSANKPNGTPLCRLERKGLPHAEAMIVTLMPDTVYRQVQITCPACGSIECFTPDLPAWEETSPTRSEESREQVRNNRLLHKHLGWPVV